MKILHTEASCGWGGQEIRILEEASGLIARGHEVGVACPPHARMAEEAARYGVDAVYASPLQRAFDTGNEIAKRLGIDVRVIDDLQEINEPLRQEGEPFDENLPLPEGVTHDDIKRKFEANPIWDNLPGSENSAHFRSRIVRAIDQIVEECPGKKVAVACHGGVIQSYVSHILGLTSDFAFYAFNASITSIRAHKHRRVLWRLNDLAHLEGTRMT